MPHSTPHRVTVISGAGRYEDPWHPFAETSAALAAVMREEGLEVSVVDDADRAFTELGETDLLVVNIGAPQRDAPAADAAVRDGLVRYVGRGGPVLSMHVSSTSLGSVPEWETITGGAWVRGTTMHPEYGWAKIRVHSDAHPIVAGIGDFEVQDERYTYLRVAEDVVPLLGHLHEGVEYPLFWTRNHHGARVAYDALGHDIQSYRSPEHRTILRRTARWLLGDL